MRSHFHGLEVKASVASGEALRCDHLREKWLRFSGTFTATIAVEISFDGGATFFQVGSNVTAAGLHEVPQAATHIRTNTTAFTSGTPAARISGWDWNG